MFHAEARRRETGHGWRSQRGADPSAPQTRNRGHILMYIVLLQTEWHDRTCQIRVTMTVEGLPSERLVDDT